MNKVFVINDENDPEASAIKVISENNKTLISIKGPMSFFAAGAFITSLKEGTSGLQSVTIEHWKNQESEKSDNYISNGFDYYWSNKLGWVHFKENASYFTDEETQTFDLPNEGKWENDRGKENAT